MQGGHGGEVDLLGAGFWGQVWGPGGGEGSRGEAGSAQVVAEGLAFLCEGLMEEAVEGDGFDL